MDTADTPSAPGVLSDPNPHAIAETLRQPSAILSRTVAAWAGLEPGTIVTPWSYERRAPRSHDVVIEVLYTGICHTDLHFLGSRARHLPVVPGHEIVGRVSETGPEVTELGAGDVVAVGTLADSCRRCKPCVAGMESYCLNGATYTFDSPDRIDGSITRGGFADAIVVDERFVYRLPAELDPAASAPLFCAGITTYSPLRHWKVGPGATVGVIGIGGLGHLGLRFARAMGAHVVAFTTSAAEVDDALALGAHEVVLSRDEAQMAAQAYRFDFLLDTVSASYPMTPMIQALALDGTLCSVGLPDHFAVRPAALTMGRRSIAGSASGGVRETTEMLDFCAQHGIVADVELIRPDGINDALRRLGANDVKYRFVIDFTG